VLRRWVQRGDTVEWFAAGFPGAAAETAIDGIHVVRAGHQWSVHLQAMRRYRGRLRGRFDAVIDEVNTMPFFTPLWAGIPSFLLMFQLAREVWWHESRFPINLVGYALEPWYLRPYRRTPAFTISQSTIDDLRRLGFQSSITLVPIGIEPVNPPAVTRATNPTFLYVGRLAPSKRVHEILEAFRQFRAAGERARLWLVGDGDPGHVARLRRLALRLGIDQDVEFLGRLDAAAKHARMAESHAVLMASVREGWGLVVTEAAACGTPALVYDVPGLRDAVRNEETGLVVKPTPAALAQAMRRIIADPALRERLASGARAWSQTFSYDHSADVLRDGIVARLS
jgi:glycosyltransferase involved in cell wall biosynthesis